MKNMKKLAAGFIAAAMAMTMSLSAFADVVDPSLSDGKKELIINIKNDNESQMTMMAYIVEGTDWTPSNAPLYSNQEIIALDQEVGSKGFTTVPVDAAKLADGNSIVVKIGASSGTLATYVIAMQAPVVTYTVTYNLDKGTVDGTNEETFGAEVKIADFFKEVTAPTKDGYNFTGWTDENGAAVDTDSDALMSTLDKNADKTVALTATYELIQQEDTPITITFKWGDVNADGLANTGDYTTILNAAFGGTKAFNFTENDVTYTFTWGTKDVVDSNGIRYTYDGLLWGDVNADGLANTGDYTTILNAAFGGTKSFTDGNSNAYTWGVEHTITLEK